MPKMNLSHFEAALLFALFTSVVLGVVTKRTDRSEEHTSPMKPPVLISVVSRSPDCG